MTAHPLNRPFLQWRFVCALAFLCGALLTATGARAAKPEIDTVYAEGNTYYMISPHMITNPNPNLFAQAEELYLLVYPLNPDGSTTLGPQTLPSGYEPQCDPCFHPGLPLPFVYHDHVLTGAPGLGNHGTAGQFKGPWKIIVLMYNPAVVFDPAFTPITSAADVDAGEAAAKFLPINPGADNPYEVSTGNVLICPFVSPSA
jgi:hypothetical protein